MMIGEGLILVVNNILITLIFGTAAGFVLVYAGKTVGADYLHWHFPAWYLFGYMVFVTAVPVAISGSMIKILGRKTLAERLKEAEG